MVRKLLFLLVVFLTAHAAVLAQSGALQGKVTDKLTKEPIPFANIIVENKGTQAGGSATDFDGKYTIKPITPGTYDVKVSFLGYKQVQITGIPIRSGMIEYLNIELESTAVQVEGVTITKYKVPLIDKDKTVTGATVTSAEISKMPNRNAQSIATSVGGVFSRDGEVGNVRGQRSEGNVTYIDGIKVRGTGSLPESAIEQVSVMLGGVPAQYGDATGGIINITTKGPSRKFGGGLELQTSQFLDPYGSHRIGLNMTGPLFMNKEKTEALLGYFIAGDFNYHKDGATLPLGLYKVNDAKLAELEKNPLRPSGTGSGTYQNAEFIRMSDLESLKTSLNSNGYDINTSGKLDVKTGKNTNLSFGGSYRAYAGNNFNLYNSIFNYNRNTISSGNEWRVFGRFTQRFPAAKEGNNLIKNIYYSIQADYTSIKNKTEDPDLKDNLFSYGYVGKFDTYKERGYDRTEDSINGVPTQIRTMNGFSDTLVTFQRAEFNPIIANYTTNYYDLYPNPRRVDDIYAGGGMLNGYNPNGVFGGVYSLWSAPGNQQAGYGKNSTTQVTANMNLSADVGNHEIKLGFTFERYSQSSYSYAPTAFWPQMFQLTNSHIIQLNLMDTIETNYQEIRNGDTTNVKQYDFGRLYDGASQRTFDINLRNAMGLPKNGTEWIDVNSYDLNSNTISYIDDKSVRHTVNLAEPISVNYFSPDEFLNSGSPFAAARGYDYYGKKLSSNPSTMDFYNKTDANGNYTREIAPNQPIYMAGYISDKFSFDDLVFNVGVRVDRFDANQSVLTDPYSLYPVKTVSEVSDLGTHPKSMGPDYVVYVDNLAEPTRIMGYRNGNSWYDSQGSVLLDPTLTLDAGNGIIPYLSGDKKREISSGSFTDYVPQISVMPRISFSFPISDEALFYAHYDVITQRPKSNAVFNPINYLFWEYDSNPTMTNPNLKPEKNVNYELGFQQKISNSSSINISAFYIESRDQIQSYRYTGAFPKTYYSYNNIDFGTVKGLTVAYDLRRTGNVRVRANYTLQFANGTGSNPETSSALIRSGQPNLRNLIPLEADQRHAIQLNVDYRYGEGADYNGPVIGGVQFLKNAGFNITMNGGSGTPYTRSSKISPLTAPVNIIQGSINGSRLPWSFRMDGRFDKDFTIATGKDSKGNKKQYFLNAYLQILNILNTQNIMSVYAATGNPDDDGYLAAAEYQSQINSQLDTQSYIDMYKISVNNPYNYSSPRMIRIGVGISF